MMKQYALVTLLMFAIPTSAASQRPGEPPAEPNSATPSFDPVTQERLLNADAEPENWLMYSGNYFGQRHSRLDQIAKGNVGQLEMQWAFQLRALDRAETTPLVVDGVMYVTEAPSNVIALDARTGSQYWRYNHDLPEDLNFCCGRNNRGVAVLGDRLYMSTLDAHLVSLDAKTGSVLWDVEVADEATGYSMTGAPLLVGDKILTGVAGGEFGIRGFIDTYDVVTGELAWRLYTIPGPDHPDNMTWQGNSWRTGGSPSWMTGSYDAELNLVYWGTGNPGPDWNGDARAGDNLYSDAVLAINPDTGEMVWY
ncbi:MAG TPA: PQQ-dependent dehydrogenase, methanol/ethanol family, partial [Gemmatimonadetes bacterium]|nr:PQQ-dependent dehydrogenase, methanol/ethanol family [Gemmatimonadota bacterium]